MLGNKGVLKLKSIRVVFLTCLILVSFVSCKVSNSQNQAESVSYYIPQIETTTLSYEIIDDVVNISSISFHIPQSFKPEPRNGELWLKSQENTIEISFEEVTGSTNAFDEYIQETIEYFRQMGLSPSVVEETYIGNYTAKRFSIDTFDATSSNVKIFCYFIENHKCKIVVNIWSKNGEIIKSEQADKYMEMLELV